MRIAFGKTSRDSSKVYAVNVDPDNSSENYSEATVFVSQGVLYIQLASVFHQCVLLLPVCGDDYPETNR